GTQLAQVDTADPRVWCWPTVGSLVGNLIQAIDPLPSFSQLNGHIGHVMTSSKLRVRQLPTNYQTVIIPIHRGATGFTNSVGLYTWDPDNTDPTLTNLYNQAVAFCQSFIAYCNAYGYSYEFDVVTWAQGEQDADTLDQPGYAAKLKRLIEKLRTDVPQTANTPVVITGMRPAWITSHPSAANIRAAHVDMARQLTRVSYVDGPTDDGNPTPDGIVHYNATEQRALGVREWKARDYAVANVLGVAPLVPGTPVVTQSATSVAITWGHDPGRVTDYAVRWRKNGGAWTTLASIPSVDRSRTVTGLTAGDVVEAQVAGINEQGQSAWSGTGSFTLVPAPAQVTGLTLGTATQHTQPLTWAAVSLATSYLVEYKTAASGTWLTFGTVTGLSSTVTGLSAAISYNYRVSAINSGGRGAASATGTGSTAAPVPLVDDVATSAYTAYGLRKQRAAYSGSAIKVRRSSDNTTLDIGFVSTGELDSAALLTFVGAGNNGFVDTIYDQSGNARHLVNTTVAQQPKIVNVGALITKNGRAAIQFAAAGALTGTFAGLWAAGQSTQMIVWSANGASQGILSGEGSASGSNARFYTGFINGSAQFSTGSIADTGATSAVAQIGALCDGTLRQLSAKETGTAMQLYVSGALVVTSALYDHSAPTTITRTAIGGVSVGGTVANLFTGFWSEQIAFTTALDDASRLRGEQNQREFYTI
ncbi:MAG: hypothetical protein JWQ74_1415, partial [Marmoricola sp.]|nr:hypothetical protein [Marmoricola sp.]